MRPPVVIAGTDPEIEDLLEELGAFDVLGVLDPNPGRQATAHPVLGDDDAWPDLLAGKPGLKAVLAVDPAHLRIRLLDHFGRSNLCTVVAPTARVAGSARIGAGCVVQHGATLLTRVHLGPGCKVNHQATAHHDCRIAEGCTLAPGARLLGGVILEAAVYIGSQAVVLPRCRIGAGATVGAGAVVTGDVPAGATVVGAPARASTQPDP